MNLLQMFLRSKLFAAWWPPLCLIGGMLSVPLYFVSYGFGCPDLLKAVVGTSMCITFTACLIGMVLISSGFRPRMERAHWTRQTYGYLLTQLSLTLGGLVLIACLAVFFIARHFIGYVELLLTLKKTGYWSTWKAERAKLREHYSYRRQYPAGTPEYLIAEAVIQQTKADIRKLLEDVYAVQMNSMVRNNVRPIRRSGRI